MKAREYLLYKGSALWKSKTAASGKLIPKVETFTQ